MSDWVSPFDRWVLSATDRHGSPLGGTVRLQLVALWSRADAPSKRSPGPQFIYGRPVEFTELARELLIGVRAVGSGFAALRDAGLAKRGYHWVHGRREAGIWLADLTNTGRFEADHEPTDADTPVGSIDPAQPDSHDQTIRRDRIKRSDAIGSNDPTRSDQTIRSLNKEDPISPRSVPDQSPIRNDDPAHNAQKSLFVGVHAANPIDALWELHEQLSVEAHAKHNRGKQPRNGVVAGKLPARGTAIGRRLLQRMKAAVRDNGFDRCADALRWRAREWESNVEQLSRPADQVWATGALSFVFGKLDVGLDPAGCGNMPEPTGLPVSRGEAPPSNVYEDVFMSDDGNFDYDAARSYYEGGGA
jgi:hypothetical protein